MKKTHSMTEMEYINVISLLFIGTIGMARGSFFIFASEIQVDKSPLYSSINEIIPLSIWGIPFFIGGLCLAIAAMALPYRNINKVYSITLILGGIICSVFFFVITLAGISDSLNWMSPLIYFLTTLTCGGYAYFGVLHYAKQ
ncbi:hypothetical protein A9J92_09440 [Staphylococcus epidermidis]|uniref:hypothetical protein n=1 Tax=Staphylococcus epidermidis TaxID=1282 RepID=UPI00024C2C10|nr:hypothetical protein [Staphylococcus epidermidis]EHQ74452.1 hypothetical protein SEVCU041_0341 [Staphylococcus epidermidis VCU041]KAB2248299.1 hypothetical protein F9B58_02350 [Staphylococcus epidermidis]KAB2255101.1 hypothetical protein F9B48_01495 [Staphylococcus epidermidis]MBV5131932.1 hypothetical protein [Staphylococcus epidermidis]OAX01848.1 hypothetical protein A9J92_09440 [Staphylococcus epidermidis]